MRWDGPYTISEKKENVNYKIYADHGKKMMIVHADRMKIFDEKSLSNSSKQIIEPQSESETETKLTQKIIKDPIPIHIPYQRNSISSRENVSSKNRSRSPSSKESTSSLVMNIPLHLLLNCEQIYGYLNFLEI
jgi:hypothetical protein